MLIHPMFGCSDTMASRIAKVTRSAHILNISIVQTRRWSSLQCWRRQSCESVTKAMLTITTFHVLCNNPFWYTPDLWWLRRSVELKKWRRAKKSMKFRQRWVVTIEIARILQMWMNWYTVCGMRLYLLPTAICLASFSVSLLTNQAIILQEKSHPLTDRLRRTGQGSSRVFLLGVSWSNDSNDGENCQKLPVISPWKGSDSKRSLEVYFYSN